MEKCSNCKTPGCPRCGTTHAMWDCDYPDEKENTALEKIREQYRKTGNEISSLNRRIIELNEILDPEKIDSISVKEYFEKCDELKRCKERLKVAKIERSVWDQAREICIDYMK